MYIVYSLINTKLELLEYLYGRRESLLQDVLLLENSQPQADTVAVTLIH